MAKKLKKSYALTTKNIATIKEHQEFIKVHNPSMALRDILDNAHIYQGWREREILKLWFELRKFGVTLDNVRIVIPLAMRANPPTKLNVDLNKKIKKMGEI